MSMIPSRLAACAAVAVAAVPWTVPAARAQSSASPAAAVGQAFGQLPEEASTAYGDLCRQKKPGAASSPDFMPDCASLLTRRLNEAKAAKAAESASPPRAGPLTGAKAGPEPKEESLARLPDLPPAVAAAEIAPEQIDQLAARDMEVVRLETTAQVEVTAVEVAQPVVPAPVPAPAKPKPVVAAKPEARPKPDRERKAQQQPRSAQTRATARSAPERPESRPPAAPAAQAQAAQIGRAHV